MSLCVPKMSFVFSVPEWWAWVTRDGYQVWCDVCDNPELRRWCSRRKTNESDSIPVVRPTSPGADHYQYKKGTLLVHNPLIGFRIAEHFYRTDFPYRYSNKHFVIVFTPKYIIYICTYISTVIDIILKIDADFNDFE